MHIHHDSYKHASYVVLWTCVVAPDAWKEKETISMRAVHVSNKTLSDDGQK